MDTTIIVALIAFGGSAVGTFGGILASSRLTNYRIEQLEKKVDKHNSVICRMYECEKEIAVLKHEMTEVVK